ncbi:hypothetical protein V6N13_032421 [Hibiscus sabdariffa]
MAISRNPIFGQLLVPSGQPPDCLTGKTNAIGVVHHGLDVKELSLRSVFQKKYTKRLYGYSKESYGLTGTELNTKTTARKSEPPVEERGSRFAVLEPVVEDINAMLNQMEPASTQGNGLGIYMLDVRDNVATAASRGVHHAAMNICELSGVGV